MNIKGNRHFTDSLERRQHAQDVAAQRSLAHAERWVDIGVAVGRAAKTAGRALVGLRRPTRDAKAEAETAGNANRTSAKAQSANA